MRRDIDLLLSIFQFEVDWFAQRGMNQVEYIGHPLAGKVQARFDRLEFCRLNNLDPAQPIIALLPGSRRKELARILPPMIDAASLIGEQQDKIQFVLVVAPSRSFAEVEGVLSKTQISESLKGRLRVVEHQTRESLAAAGAAAICSGTATLEAALLNTPMVIVYKESAVNWHTLGSLTHPDHYGLPNIVAGRRLFTELMQNDFNPQRLAAELLALLDSKRQTELLSELQMIREQLGENDASSKAAERILHALAGWRTRAGLANI
jgi:lipid-A-disaccharide synthase